MKAPKRARELMSRLSEIRGQKEQLSIVEKTLEFELRELVKAAPERKYETKDMVATYVESTRISYSVDEMRKVFPKEVFRKLVDIEYVVDRAAMSDLLEDHPKLRKHIRPTLKQVVAANKAKIEAAHDKGIVSLEELKRCCTIQTTEYTRMTRKDRG